MRSRLGNGWAAAWTALTAVVRSAIGIEEVAIYTALALIAWGCWFVWKPGAAIVPGVVMLWLYLPPRAPFLSERPPAGGVRRKD